jgi:hypothetical protein
MQANIYVPVSVSSCILPLRPPGKRKFKPLYCCPSSQSGRLEADHFSQLCLHGDAACIAADSYNKLQFYLNNVVNFFVDARARARAADDPHE